MSAENSYPANPVFRPAVSEPFIDVEKRIAELKGLLNEQPLDPQKSINIQAAIKLYESKELPKRLGDVVYIQDGKICPGLPALDRPFLVEGCLLQLPQIILPEAAAPKQHQQLYQSATFTNSSRFAGHEIYVRMRIPPTMGGDGVSMAHVILMNDTGSNAQSIYQEDLVAMNYNPHTYMGSLGEVSVVTPGGTTKKEQFAIEVQVVRQDGSPVTPWFIEHAILSTSSQVPRLTGTYIRDILYFGTAPKVDKLFVAEKKNGLVELLPVV